MDKITDFSLVSILAYPCCNTWAWRKMPTMLLKIKHIRFLPCYNGLDQKTDEFVDVENNHCSSDLLIRNQFKDLPFNILAVIGNHDILRELTEKFSIPFHYLPAENINREVHEKQIEELTIRSYPILSGLIPTSKHTCEV